MQKGGFQQYSLQSCIVVPAHMRAKMHQTSWKCFPRISHSCRLLFFPHAMRQYALGLLLVCMPATVAFCTPSSCLPSSSSRVIGRLAATSRQSCPGHAATGLQALDKQKGESTAHFSALLGGPKRIFSAAAVATILILSPIALPDQQSFSSFTQAQAAELPPGWNSAYSEGAYNANAHDMQVS